MFNKYRLFVKALFIYIRMLRNQWLKPAELRELQDRKLRALIRHSYRNVPYYHSLFKKAKIYPDDIKTVDDLGKIPISKKDDIRDLPIREITAKNIDLSRCWIRSTSGSTGVPISIPWTSRSMVTNWLSRIRRFRACGNKMTNRILLIGPGWLPTNYLIQRIGILKTKHISPLERFETQIEEIRKFKPNVFYGFPSCLRIITVEIREGRVQGINPSLFFTGGEMLDEYTRRLNREVFGAETYDGLGTNETGNICWECIKREGYHVVSDLALVELTKDNEVVSVGERGEITATNLHNYAGPIIRYNIEESSSFIEDECSCGRCFPLMKIIEGRKSDVIRLPDGRIISSLYCCWTLWETPGIKHFRLIQEKRDLFLVEVVKDSRYTDRTVEEIKQRLRDVVGEAEVNVVIVDEISRERSGKFKQFVTKVNVSP